VLTDTGREYGMIEQQPAQADLATEHALCFLTREPLLNFHIISSLLHEQAEVTCLVASGQAVTGVAVAKRDRAGKQTLLRLDAAGPAALRRLLTTLPERPERLILHRPWHHAEVARHYGTVRRRSSVQMFAASQSDLAGWPDARVRALSLAEVGVARQGRRSWILDQLYDRLASGCHAFGIYSGGQLVSHACCAFSTGTNEEICDLFTAPAHRGRGLAPAVVDAAARAILAQGRQPVYFSRGVNEASQRVALRCGFKPIVSLQEFVVDS
jgi:RimJ/RimL family protein N-acetyltransferase